jgi:serine/threonine protein kinase
MSRSSFPAPAGESPDEPASVERLVDSIGPAWIGERYRVLGLLGRGGMAAVYRVMDGERELALKQLKLPDSTRQRASIEALFEQEFRTLAQLDHPRVIRVYDYG